MPPVDTAAVAQEAMRQATVGAPDTSEAPEAPEAPEDLELDASATLAIQAAITQGGLLRELYDQATKDTARLAVEVDRAAATLNQLVRALTPSVPPGAQVGLVMGRQGRFLGRLSVHPISEVTSG